MISSRLVPAALAACLLVGTVAVRAETAADPAKPQAQSSEARAERRLPGVLALLPRDSVTEHVLEAGGERLAYTAKAGTFALFDQSGEPSAAVFYTAYTLKGASKSRPVTFVFNGGPGAASVYLHLGVVGPRIVTFGPEASGAEARLRDNPDTWLKFTDIVAIDPVGSGWSRAAKPDGNKDFWGVWQDANALAKVIALYLAHNDRMASPKFLLGESYGGFRAAKVARALQQEQGIVVSGMILLSPFLDGTLHASTRHALGAALQFPSLAAAEMDRRGTFSAQALKAAERFAMTDYLVTLAGPPPEGDAAKSFYARIAELTGLPADIVARARGFIGESYRKHSPGPDRVVSPYDATFVAPDPFPESMSSEGADPILDGHLQALGGAFVAYARDELGFKTDMTFMLLNRDVSGRWDWGRGGRQQASAVRDLRELLALNPALRLFVVHGRSDIVTPYGISRYILDHLPAFARERSALQTYRGGHMFYFDEGSRAAFAADAKAFYRVIAY